MSDRAEPAAGTAARVRIDHVALWTRDLEGLRDFYMRHFGAESGPRYASRRQAGFTSYFLTLPGGGARLELMALPALGEAVLGRAVGWAHLALAVGDSDAVDTLVARLVAAGVRLVSAARTTGDGYYEAVIADPDGNLVEIVAAN